MLNQVVIVGSNANNGTNAGTFYLNSNMILLMLIVILVVSTL